MEAGKLGILVWLFFALYAAFVGVAFLKLLPEISRRGGFLATSSGQQAQPERAQAMIISIATLSLLGFWGAEEVATGSGSLPDIPAELLAAFGISQATYLGGKWFRTRGRV